MVTQVSFMFKQKIIWQAGAGSLILTSGVPVVVTGFTSGTDHRQTAPCVRPINALMWSTATRLCAGPPALDAVQHRLRRVATERPAHVGQPQVGASACADRPARPACDVATPPSPASFASGPTYVLRHTPSAERLPACFSTAAHTLLSSGADTSVAPVNARTCRNSSSISAGRPAYGARK